MAENDRDDSTRDLTRTTQAHMVARTRQDSGTKPAGRVPSSARLVCVAGIDLGRSFPIGVAPLIIGRGGESAARLTAHDVSRHHARVTLNIGEVVLEDLGSRNGTFANDVPVVGPTPIHVGTRIQLGDSTILVLAHHDELEAKMRQLQKLESMEQMVGGLAHDFNNVLTVVLAGLDYISASPPPGPPDMPEVIEELKRAASGAAVLAKRLMNFRQQESPPQDSVLLLPCVEGALALARHVISAPIEFSMNIAPYVYLRGSCDELQQVLLNLFLNARDAMPSGGKVTLTAQIFMLDRTEATARHLPAEGAYVELVIEDDGAGMSEPTLARAFEPFFTTKEPGRGTGLGLAMVHNIVRRHGGAIEVESAVGVGTTFRIWLPSAG